jgi:hypothetical protein
MIVPGVRRTGPTADRRDREMRCPACKTRVFTSRAPDLVAAHFGCPRCETELELVGPVRGAERPAEHAHLGPGLS